VFTRMEVRLVSHGWCRKKLWISSLTDAAKWRLTDLLIIGVLHWSESQKAARPDRPTENLELRCSRSLGRHCGRVRWVLADYLAAAISPQS
jgi:hypothetical protein